LSRAKTKGFSGKTLTTKVLKRPVSDEKTTMEIAQSSVKPPQKCAVAAFLSCVEAAIVFKAGFQKIMLRN
jgi:hypothetical protein